MTFSVADTHANAQKMVSVAKMVAVLEVCNTEEQLSVVRFFSCKRTQCKGYP
jgi:hypothetical protein